MDWVSVLLIGRSSEDAENALWTLVSTRYSFILELLLGSNSVGYLFSFGLTIAALVQVQQNMLTLLNGMLGMDLFPSQWISLYLHLIT